MDFRGKNRQLLGNWQDWVFGSGTQQELDEEDWDEENEWDEEEEEDPLVAYYANPDSERRGM